jgi:hypothetical protein
MTWLRKNTVVIVTLSVLFGGGLVTWGRMQQLCTQIEAKADSTAVTRELDLIQKTLDRIETKLDNHMQK